MSDNVITGQFGGSPFRESGELYEAIWAAIMQFEGRVPTMAVVGVLRLVEHHILSEAHQ